MDVAWLFQFLLARPGEDRKPHFPPEWAVAADFAMKHPPGIRDLLLVSGFPQIDLISTVPTVQGAVNMFVLCFETLI